MKIDESQLARRYSQNIDLQQEMQSQQELLSLQQSPLVRALYRIAELTHNTENLHSLYSEIQKIVGELMYAENFFIALYDESLTTVSFVYFRDVVDKQLAYNFPVKHEGFKDSLSGYVLRIGEPYLATHAELKRCMERGVYKIRGSVPQVWLGVPLYSNNQMVGVMALQSYETTQAYGESEKELLVFVSQQIAAAIIGKRTQLRMKVDHDMLELEVRKRTTDLLQANNELELRVGELESARRLQEVLFEIADLTNSHIGLGHFLRQIYANLSSITRANNFFTITWDSDNKLDFKYVEQHRGFEIANLDLSHLAKKNSLIYEVWKRQQTRICREEMDEFNRYIETADSSSMCWIMVSPLIHKKSCFGVIGLIGNTNQRRGDDENEELLEFVAQHIATAIHQRTKDELLKEVNDQLQNSNDMLEQRILDRTKELISSNKRLTQTLKQRKKVEKHLAHAANHDSLTGLPNRKALLTLLGTLLENQNNIDHPFAVLFLDLDRFKLINDGLGHSIGDQLLQHFSKRLRNCCPKGNLVARLGGDEFCVVMTEASEQDVIAVAEQINDELERPFEIDSQQLYVTCSIGITVSDRLYSDAQQVLRDADSAMYEAKAKGKACYFVFNKQIREKIVRRLRLENAFKHAINDHEVFCEYQPILDIETFEVVGFEALARWSSEKYGQIGPDEFIRIAEEVGLIGRLSNKIMATALQDLKRWQQLSPYYENLSMNVNLSASEIQDKNLYNRLYDLVKKNGLQPKHLHIEITESILVDDINLSKSIMQRLDDAGFDIILDDFGTGFSSLTYLNQLPIKTIKIDKSFIAKLSESENSVSIVRALVFLAREFAITIIAEGLEDQKHLDMLRDLGVYLAQGFLITRPMNAQQMTKYLQQNLSHRMLSDNA